MERRTLRPAGRLLAGLLLIAPPLAGALAANPVTTTRGESSVSPRVQIEPSGYATVLHAPPASRPVARMKRYEPEETRLMRELGISLEDARRRVNTDKATDAAAQALHLRLREGVPDNYVDRMIVRDPYARYAFKFRQDAAATLARFTSDARFVALQGGIPRHELEPEFEAWTARFIEQGILSAFSIDAFEGRMEFELNIGKPRFELLAAENGWVIPEHLHLEFAPSPDPNPVDAALAGLIRNFPQNERGSGPTTLEYSSARLILRDGCFRVIGTGGAEPLVMFSAGVRLELDAEGYLILLHPLAVAHGQGPVRVGEIVLTGGLGHYDETDSGTVALREACGDGPILALGTPEGEQEFNQRYPPE